ncbi:hypothetical protein ACS0TY_011351 [Phlomoides rotata]
MYARASGQVINLDKSEIVFSMGLHWTVGNGSQIHIWDEGGEVQVVSDLIDHTRWSWDLPRVTALFPKDVVARILAIPVGEAELSDELIWRFNKDGIYSAQSRYVDGTSLEMVRFRKPIHLREEAFSHAQILDSSLRLVSEFWGANPRGGVLQDCMLLKGWEPPAHGRVKLNTDASIRSGWGTGVAGLLRDSAGRVVWCFAESYHYDRVLQIASDKGVAEIVVEADSLTLVTANYKRHPDLFYFGRIVRRIVELSESFGSVSFSWTRRTGNRTAHRLASFAFLCSDNFFNVFVPETLVPVVNADLLAA